jgi:hypothetical protein
MEGKSEAISPISSPLRSIYLSPTRELNPAIFLGHRGIEWVGLGIIPT